MVWPLLLGGLGLLGTGAALGVASSKKEGSLIKVGGSENYSPAQNIHQPFETYSPTSSVQQSYVYTPQYSYTAQIGSPGATATTKKEDTISGTQRATQEPYIAPVSSASAEGSKSGISNTTIIIIAAVVVAGLWLTRK